MLAITFSFYLLFASAAARRCVDKYYATPECLTKCQFKMGYPGMIIGRGSWDSVISPTDSSEWTALISQACGLSAEASGSSSVAPEAAGTLPPSVSSTPTPSPSANSSASTSSSQTTLLASSSSSSTSSSSTSFSNHASSTISTSSSISTSSQKNSAAATTTAVAVKAQLAHPTSTSSSSQTTPSTTAAAKSSQSSQSSQTADSPSTPADTSTSNSDIESYLSGHNAVRAAHGAKNLVWSDSLAASAQQWANGCLFQHSTSGENLAAGTGSAYDISAAITSWANEASSYDPNNPQPSHFTQLVWKSTSQLGCGKQMCDGIFPESYGKALYVVCHYSVAGNVDDEYAQNVQV